MATAAAVATFSESTPGAIGMRTRRSHAARAASLNPGPSAPTSSAIRGLRAATSDATSPMGSAPAAGVRARSSNPHRRNSPSPSGHAGTRVHGTRSTWPSETRTLLKAFSDFVEQEDLAEEQAREKTQSLVDYASTQARLGEPITVEELSGLLDEDKPRAFYDHIRNSDYGLAPEIPPDKRTLNQFRRFTGRAEGLSISFEAHLLGSRVEYDETTDTLTIRQVPTQLKDQLKQGKTTLAAVLERAESDDVVGKLKVSAVLQALPGIGKIRATQIMEKLKIADSRRLRGLGEQQRKALLGEFAAN